MAQWASWHICQNHTQKYPKLISVRRFEVDVPENFQKRNILEKQVWSLKTTKIDKKSNFYLNLKCDALKIISEVLRIRKYVITSSTLGGTAFIFFKFQPVFVILNFLEIFFSDLWPGFSDSVQVLKNKLKNRELFKKINFIN